MFPGVLGQLPRGKLPSSPNPNLGEGGAGAGAIVFSLLGLLLIRLRQCTYYLLVWEITLISHGKVVVAQFGASRWFYGPIYAKWLPLGCWYSTLWCRIYRGRRGFQCYLDSNWLVYLCLQSVAECLGLALAFVWDSTLWVGFCFFRGFLLVLAKFSLWRGEWTLGYHFMGFRHFPNIS